MHDAELANDRNEVDLIENRPTAGMVFPKHPVFHFAPMFHFAPTYYMYHPIWFYMDFILHGFYMDFIYHGQ